MTVLEYVNQRKKVLNETCQKNKTLLNEQNNNLIDIDTFQLMLEQEVKRRFT